MTTGLLITTAGQAAIIADLGGGADLVLTHVAWGDAAGVPYNPNASQTILVNEKYRATIASVAVVAGAIVVDAVIPADTPDGSARPSHGFNVAEVGLFNAAGTLIGVARCGNGYKPPPSSGQAHDVTYRLKLAVANPSAITVVIDPLAQINLGRHVRPFWLAVEGVVNNPPGAPALGSTYVIGAAPTGAWSGFANRLAQWVGVWTLATVPMGHVVCDNSKAEDLSTRYMRRTAVGWATAAAATDAYGFLRLATAAEAKARTATDVALTPAGLDNAASGLAEKQPIYPEVLTGANALTATASAGQVVIDPAQTWQHRGLATYGTNSFAAPDRTFATVASKTYHLVWDAPGTGLATPLAAYPAGRFSLIDRTAASPVETDRSYDTTYDRMLCQRVVTNGANVPTVTPLKNKADLHATLEFASYYTQTSGFGGLTYQNITLNWARTPQLQFAKIDLDVTLGTESLMQFNAPCTRYGGSSWAFGYALVSSVNTYISGYHIVEARA
ncbi:phage tail-collar fiber domain-containing protein [Bosea sp. (in: a-proteobacteria)]